MVHEPVPPDDLGDDPGQIDILGRQIFGDAFGQAQAYAGLLTGRAAEWGLIGPREAGRVWGRHVFNSAALAALVKPGCSVADVGSGAGLPGLPLAIARPDLQVTLIESLQRRARFLRLAVDELELGDRVTVAHSRAEQVKESFDVVASRAVAPLPTLVPWCLRLTRSSGEVLAMRGSQAHDEVADFVSRSPTMRSRVTVEIHPAPGSTHPLRVVRVSV